MTARGPSLALGLWAIHHGLPSAHRQGWDNMACQEESTYTNLVVVLFDTLPDDSREQLGKLQDYSGMSYRDLTVAKCSTTSVSIAAMSSWKMSLTLLSTYCLEVLYSVVRTIRALCTQVILKFEPGNLHPLLGSPIRGLPTERCRMSLSKFGQASVGILISVSAVDFSKRLVSRVANYPGLPH